MVDMPYNPTQPNHIYLIYMYKEDLALNNLQWLMCLKTKPNEMIYVLYTINDNGWQFEQGNKRKIPKRKLVSNILLCYWWLFCLFYLQELAKQLKSAPLDCLTTRLATCVCIINKNNGGWRAVAQLWQEVVLELRYRLENNFLISG